jgi:HPt (histidine-containing phosphotransfer) domain-containing protein
METPNLDYIYKMSGGDVGFEQKMISIIKTELAKEKEQFSEAMAASDYKQAAQMVHKLKHKISLLGLEESYQKAHQFEDNLNADSKVLEQDFIDILNIMTTFINDQ